jgi:hypothetical protein
MGGTKLAESTKELDRIPKHIVTHDVLIVAQGIFNLACPGLATRSL